MTTDERALLQSALTDAEYALKQLKWSEREDRHQRAIDALERINDNLEKLLNDEDD